MTTANTANPIPSTENEAWGFFCLLYTSPSPRD